MKRASIALALVAVLTTQPCLAAVDHREGVNVEHRSAAFAGLTARLGFGAAKPELPTARLKLGMTHSSTGSSAPSRLVQSSGLELGFTSTVRPDLFIGGRKVAEMKKQLGIAGVSTTLLVVGGLAIAAAAALLIMDDGPNACIPEDLDCVRRLD